MIDDQEGLVYAPTPVSYLYPVVLYCYEAIIIPNTLVGKGCLVVEIT